MRAIRVVRIFLILCTTAAASLSNVAASAQTNTLLAHFTWTAHKKDDLDPAVRVYRRYALEDAELARNIFVFSCPRDKSETLLAEIIPPRRLLPLLSKLVGGNTAKTEISIIGNGREAHGIEEVDDVAGFMNVKDEHLETSIKLLGDSSVQVQMFDKKLSYGLKSDMSAATRITALMAHPQVKQDVGTMRYLTSEDVISECTKFRGK